MRLTFPAIVLASLSVASAASAQVLTVTGGIVQARTSEADDSDRGMVLGVQLTLPVADGLSLRPEASYAQRHAFWARNLRG